jgi:hypothetical protein
MTEAEWRAGTDVGRMLRFLRGQAGPRKFRLFACACCRRVWEALSPNQRRAVEAAERYADRAIRLADLKAARPPLRDEPGAHWAAVWAVRAAAAPRDVAHSAGAAARDCRDVRAALGWPVPQPPEPRKWLTAGEGVKTAEEAAQRELLCDVFGDPFRPAVIDPAWRAWRDGTVPRLARGLYEEGRFADLPVLADALEEAGCADERLLGHCRSGGAHVRGCWVLDLLLDKR